jgi:hypothetical protein
MEIKVRSLTTCEVADDGGAISLGFEDMAGNLAAVSVSLNQVGALIMTLPGLLEAALKARYGDQSLRYAYPLASWVLEQIHRHDPAHHHAGNRGRLQGAVLDPESGAEPAWRSADPADARNVGAAELTRGQSAVSTLGGSRRIWKPVLFCSKPAEA